MVKEMVDDGLLIDGQLEFATDIMRSSVYEDRATNRELDRIVWDTGNMEESLRTAQRICKIQTTVQQYNHGLGDVDCDEKKVILSLPGLILHGEHERFLRFWFNDPILFQYGWKCKRFVLC